jgi:Domain of unknown function (DUF4148)
MKTKTVRFATTIAIAISAMISALPAIAQTSPGADSGINASSTKAQRKAARKEARARKNAELKKLEDSGYNPGARDDENYPQDIQNAEKKAAGTPRAASQ